MYEFLKVIAVPIVTAVLGLIGGFFTGIWTGVWTERWRRRWLFRDDFANDVYSLRKELLALGDNVDQRFLEWHAHSVRKLSLHVNYAATHEPKYWSKIEAGWTAYQSACNHRDPAEVLIIDKIDTKEILKRLDELLHEIRTA